MKKFIIVLVALVPLLAQQQYRWSATTGNVAQTGATYTATVQQKEPNGPTIYLDQIVVYCSVACTVTQTAYGTGATAMAGTIVPVIPTPPNTRFNFGFWSPSNAGAGTQQGGITNLPAGATTVLCLSTTCGNPTQVTLPNNASTGNYSVTINAITGTSNITFYGRSE